MNDSRFFHFIFAFVIFAASPLYAVEWSLTDPDVWSREAGAIQKSSVELAGREIIRIDHTGEKDWAMSDGKRLAVAPGDVIRMTARLRSEGQGVAEISVVTRTADGQTENWSYAARQIRSHPQWTDLVAEFIVPKGAATIEPRIIGSQPATVWVDRFSLKKTGVIPLGDSNAEPVLAENRFLKVEIDRAKGLFSVTDKRTGRVWESNPEGMRGFASVESKLGLTLIDMESMRRFTILFSLENDAPELRMTVTGNGEMPQNITFPPAFASRPGDRLIIPVNEGVGYPAEAQDIRVRRLIAYGGHGICMAFWGQIEDATGAGMMGILETPDDASIEIAPRGGLLQVGAVWEPSARQFRYPRQLRLVFFDGGGHVAVCKRYREHAKKIGLFKPFTEKVKTNPNIDILLGAANIWCWEVDRVKLVRQMRELGFDRLLISSGGSTQQIKEMNEIPNVLTSRYDIYQDIMDPANFGKVHVHGDWTTDAWPHDINWTDAGGTWRRGWQVEQKDKTQPRIPCAVICDAKAVSYAKKRISEELKTKPFTCRFIDTTVAAPWYECYHPDHPMTRSDSRHHKMELLKLVGDLGLVCGSETGHDASVPFCDYFEGMLSLGPYRIHESGRNMTRLVEDVPPQITDFQVNAAVRLPLWELVYHDCTVAHWYWGDYNNKLPAVWRKRDLFNALYGTPPMYMFTKTYWEENKARFVESYQTAAPSSRATAYAEMTDHRILSDDRLVQQTVFSNGVSVTVNFSDKPFTLPDGATLGACNWKMDKQQ